MGRAERIYAIDRLLKERGALTLDEFTSILEVSRATFRRDLDYLRERLHGPVLWDPAEKKYRYDTDPQKLKSYALPGLWFNQTEIHALLAMQELLAEIEPGLLAHHVGPLRKKLLSILDEGKVDHVSLGHRVKISPLGKRRSSATFFGVVANAVLHRHQLRISHYNRHKDETVSRDVSPLRLVYYRDNWYIDAWCHLREELRSFAVDAMRAVVPLSEPAIDVPCAQVSDRFDAGYGIFSSQKMEWVTLRFTPYRARWVANEVWHRDQLGSYDEVGNYTLRLPYSDPRELLGDVLRQGAECEVLEPESFRNMIADEVLKLQGVYGVGAGLGGR